MSHKQDLEQVHVALPELVHQLKDGKLERRDFLRLSTLLGLSATAAYALAGIPSPWRRPRRPPRAGRSPSPCA